MTDGKKTDDAKLHTMGMVLGCAVKVIAFTLEAIDDPDLARRVRELYAAERWDELAALLERMSISYRPD